MKNKTSFQPIFFYGPLLITVLFACILLQTGCDNAGGQTKKKAHQVDSNHWITMTITFKSNTDEQFRENAIRDIEKMWIKEATPFTKKTKNLYPSICVTKFPFLDTLKYRLSLLDTYFSISGSGEPQPLTVMSAPAPPCPPCPGLCPACDSTRSYVSSAYNIASMVFE